jgi:hypothetical protein
MATSVERLSGIIGQTCSAVELIGSPKLAQIYSYVYHNDEVEAKEIAQHVGVSKNTMYDYVNTLVDCSLLRRVDTTPPYTYRAKEIELVVSTPSDTNQFTISPPLIEAVGYQCRSEVVSAYVDLEGVDGLLTALEYAKKRINGTMTRYLMSQDLDISPYCAEVITQALSNVIHHHGFENKTDVYSSFPMDALEPPHNCIIDLGTVVAVDHGTRGDFKRLEHLADRLGSTLYIPQSTYTQLCQSGGVAQFEPPVDAIERAINDGWLTVVGLSHTHESGMEKMMDGVWTQISERTGRHDIEIDRRDTVLGGLVTELSAGTDCSTVILVDTDTTVMETTAAAIDERTSDVSIMCLDPESVVTELGQE